MNPIKISTECSVCTKPLDGCAMREFNGVAVCSPECCSVLINREIAQHDGSTYDSDYFMRGRETGKSLYEDYRWLPEATLSMVAQVIGHLRIAHDDTVLDFGCARGYVVKAFREMGYDARGVDVSEWAIRNADENTKPYLQRTTDAPALGEHEFDWVIAKDVLEHIEEVRTTIDTLMKCAKKGVFVVVPLSLSDGQPYVILPYEKDVTHFWRLTLPTWAAMFMRPGWTVEASYRVPGIKGHWYKEGWEWGNGFIVARRVECYDKREEAVCR